MLKIFDLKAVAAPMAGISDRTFRDIVRAMGAGAAYGEMVSAQALCYENKKTRELLDIKDEAGPRIVQLFGSEPKYMEQAACFVRELGAEYIDINMGCPVPKVVRNGEGSFLLRKPQIAASLVQAAAKSGLPVSVKIRAGWDSEHKNAPEFACRMEQAGAWLISVHGRTREQFYAGTADREIIARVKEAVNIPVLANGDVFSAADAVSLLAETGCDGVMVGRGMLGNPWIFREIKAALQGDTLPARPTVEQIIKQALAHLREHMHRGGLWYCRRENDFSDKTRMAGERLACCSMRNAMGWYMKGLRGAAALRAKINTLDNYQDIETLLLEYAADFAGDTQSEEFSPQ